ncbi:MAG: SigE family RNA polymerase sigma factor [Actinomycetota bacterium]|nr:SigE family RNA polymerase sigma factor [Actinomycetota bacterium]
MSRSGKAERDAAFTAFMVAAEPSLMRTAWLLTGSSDAARELVQASLVKTYASWSTVRPESALAFTRRVLVNHKVDVWRARSREVLGDNIDRPAVGGSGASDDRDQIVRLLARLPEQQRKVVVLRYYADLSEQATAEALGVCVGTVKSTASRALATLRGLVATPLPSPDHTAEPERSAR